MLALTPTRASPIQEPRQGHHSCIHVACSIPGSSTHAQIRVGMWRHPLFDVLASSFCTSHVSHGLYRLQALSYVLDVFGYRSSSQLITVKVNGIVFLDIEVHSFQQRQSCTGRGSNRSDFSPIWTHPFASSRPIVLEARLLT